jgi:ketosteroid isomerase-like protein
VIASVTLFFLSAASAPAALPPDLARAVESYEAAQIAGDVAALSDLVADDFVLVNSDSSVQDKASFLADFRVPGFHLDSYVVEAPFRRVWSDAALVGGRLRLGWTQDGRSQARVLRIGYVWRKRGGRWQATYAQLTRVPE